VTLHWTAGKDSRFWEATTSFPAFLLPNLQSLELSCVEITKLDTESALQRFERQTNLKSLTFTKSIVSPSALVQILSLPRALQSFTLHEASRRTSYFTPFLHSVVDDISTFNRALAQQSESLVSLDIKRRDELSHSPSSVLLRLSDFNSLSYLRLGPFKFHNFGRQHEVRVGNLSLDLPLPPRLTKLCLDGVSASLLSEPGRERRLDATLSGIRAEELLENSSTQEVPLELDITLYPFTQNNNHDSPLEALRNFARHFERKLRERHPSLQTSKQGQDESNTLPEPSRETITDSSSSRRPSVHFRILTATRVLYGEHSLKLTTVLEAHNA
jgi:hypothetical protein